MCLAPLGALKYREQQQRQQQKQQQPQQQQPAPSRRIRVLLSGSLAGPRFLVNLVLVELEHGPTTRGTQTSPQIAASTVEPVISGSRSSEMALFT